ncbi:MAG: alanine--tRNA ligase, partial [Ruminococcaceae bacterium]|nr:alanine--tRNA ligase [Oscillospiraceae bacterium]
LRIITDHIRSTTFLVCDGVVPTNEGRGYVLRRLLRRAARHGRLLGIKGTFLTDIVAVVAKENETAYPELTEKLDYIQKIIGIEENKFAQTIDSGLEMLNEMVAEAKAASSSVLAGKDVFKLNDTFGFPIDLTRELASENGLAIDEEGFKACLDEQKARSRAATAALGDFGWVGETFEFLEGLDKTEFTGYTDTVTEAKVVKIVNAETKETLDAASEGKVIVILDKTPFYGEGGGQVGDTGKIFNDTSKLKVTNTKKHDDIFMHICDIEDGMVSVGDAVTAKVCNCRRNAIKRNHSAVHLLQAALRQVLGNHVEQAGSYVDNERLRFDFRHFAAMTAEELAETEKLVNKVILEGLEITTVETDVESAKAMGAMALFGEKYGNLVRVVKMGDFSTELCGGTHLDNTAKAGLFKIISETSVAAGVRRIEATTGMGVLNLIAEKDELITNTAKELKSANTADIAKRAVALQAELKAAKSEIEALNGKIAASKASELTKDAKEIKGLTVVATETKDITVDVARTMCDNIKADNPKAVIVLSCNCEGKLNFVAACGKDAVAAGAHAGNIVKTISVIAGGKGGGRPDSAVSGAKDADKIAEALEAVYTTVEGMLKI